MVGIVAAWIVTGAVSERPHQHMIDTKRAKEAHYFDLDDGGQIVAYSERKLPDGVRLRLTGSEHVLEGRAKRPGDTRRVSEKQLVVEKVEVLPSIDELVAALPATRAALVEAKLAAIPALITALDDPARAKESEAILLEIVTPPLSRQRITATAPKSDRKLSIDWKPWWERNRHRSLRAIHDALLPHVDRYWSEGGVTQTVPVEDSD